MKTKLITVLKYLWILAIIVFISLYFYTHFESIINIVNHIPFSNLLLAFITLFIAKILLSYTALLSVNYVSINIPFSKMFSMYNITQLAKYIPGSIWQFVGRAGIYAKEGMSTPTIKKSIFIEMLWVLSSALILGSLLVLSGDILNIQFIISKAGKYFIYYSIAIVLFLIISGFYYRKTFSFISLFLQNSFLNVKMVLTLVPVWFLLGMSFFITLTPYMENMSTTLYIDIVGLYALAYAIGFLVPFAPAGIGIREAILVAGISTLISTEEAIVLASLNRIIYIILEVGIVFGLIQFKFYKYKNNKEKI